MEAKDDGKRGLNKVSSSAERKDGEVVTQEKEWSKEGLTGGSKGLPKCKLCCAVILFCLGVALIVVGALITDLVNDRVEDGVEDNLEFKIDSDFRDVDQKVWDVTFWNITNAYDVQMSGAKPLLAAHPVDMVEKEFRYDAELQDNGDTVEFWSHWTYKPANEDEDFKFRNQTLVALNGMYIGGLGRLGLAESQLFAGFAGSTTAQVRGLFLDETSSPLLGAFPFLLYPVYLGTARTAAVSGGVVTTEEVPAQWGRSATVEGGLEAAFQAAGANDTAVFVAAPFEYFAVQAGLPEAIPDAMSTYLWDPESFYGFFSSTGIGAWLRFTQGVSSGATPEVAAESLPNFHATFVGLTDPDTVDGFLMGTALFLGTVTMQSNVPYLTTLATAVASTGDIADEDVPDFTGSPSWSKMGAQQFAAGSLTSIMGVGDSILALGISDAIVAGPEYARYQSVHATVAAPDDMTYLEAIAFLDTFGQPETQSQPTGDTVLSQTLSASSTPLCQGFIAQVAASQETLDPALELIFLAQFAQLSSQDANATVCFQTALGTMIASERYAGIGLSPTTFAPYAQYLSTHLPRDYLFRGSVIGNVVDPANPLMFDLLPDGTGTKNSGLFTRRTVNELLFGYEDVLLDLILETASEETLAVLPSAYYGFLGETYVPDTVEEQRAIYEGVPASEWPYVLPRIFKVRTGKSNREDYKRWVHWRNASTFVLREDIASIPREQEVWSTPTTIGDYGVGDKFRTYQMELCPKLRDGDCDRDIQDGYAIWIPKAFRPATMQYIGDSRVKGIFTQRYTYNESVFLLTDFNKEKYFAEDSYMLNMEPPASAAPVVISLPKQGKADEERRAQFEYVDNANDFDPEANDIFLHIEPVSGLAVKSNVRFQINFKLRAATHDVGLYNSIFQNGNASNPVDDLVWPFYWTDEEAEITDDDSDSLKDGLYGSVESARIMMIVFLVFGPIFVILSLLCCCYFAKDASK